MESHAVLEGWHCLKDKRPYLIGKQCSQCDTYYFPPKVSYCRNPDCDSDSFKESLLSRTGTLWSFTKQYYPPPPPYVLPKDEEFQPYIIAAVMLEKEKMIVLGHMTNNTMVDEITVGDSVELTLQTLFKDEHGEHIVWKWKKC